MEVKNSPLTPTNHNKDISPIISLAKTPSKVYNKNINKYPQQVLHKMGRGKIK